MTLLPCYVGESVFFFEGRSTMNILAQFLRDVPLVAILRGVQTHEVLAIAEGLYETGFRCIEIPLNSPNALESIALLVKELPDDCLIGAGTVLTPAQVQAVHAVGGQLIVMPHCDLDVIQAAKRLDLVCAPGVATLSEAFAALKAGADGLKLFPSESVPPSVLNAWRTVLPKDVICLPVGGVKPEGMQLYLGAGANGFGLGSNLYKPGHTAEQVKAHAQAYIAALGR
jgi:2-dehydro-3-deoxyphosphogalactonate aldolase